MRFEANCRIQPPCGNEFCNVIAVSLFDKTGVMLQPWHDAGVECHLFDIQHKAGSFQGNDGIWRHGYDLTNLPMPLLELLGKDIVFTSCFPPCQNLSVSGARWMAGKGLRALQQSISFFATSAEFAELAGGKYLIENPTSTISTYWRESNHKFHPAWYAGYSGIEDNYTKETHLWTGHGFKMPPRKTYGDLLDGPDKTYIHHQPPGEERADIRSATPKGFALAVFEENYETSKA